jgi:hypothetical protein
VKTYVSEVVVVDTGPATETVVRAVEVLRTTSVVVVVEVVDVTVRLVDFDTETLVEVVSVTAWTVTVAGIGVDIWRNDEHHLEAGLERS